MHGVRAPQTAFEAGPVHVHQPRCLLVAVTRMHAGEGFGDDAISDLELATDVNQLRKECVKHM